MRSLALALGLLAASAHAAGTEVGASLWHVIPFEAGFGARETISVGVDFPVTREWLRVRASLRASSSAAIEGSLLLQPQFQLLGSFNELAPVATLLIGREVGIALIQFGLGLAYNVRLVQTQESIVGIPVQPGPPGIYGTVKSLSMTFDPGLDTSFEVGFALPAGFRLILGAGISLAMTRLIVQTSENSNLEIAIPRRFFTASGQLGLRWAIDTGKSRSR